MSKNLLAKQQAKTKKQLEAAYEQGRIDGFCGGVQAGFEFWYDVVNSTKGIGPAIMERVIDRAADMAKEAVEAGEAVGVGIKYMRRLATWNGMLPADTKTEDGQAK